MLAIFVVPVKNSKTGNVPTHAPIDGSMYDFRIVDILFFVGSLSAALLIISIPTSAEKLRRNPRSYRSKRGFRNNIAIHAMERSLQADTTLPHKIAINASTHIITALTTLLSRPQINA